MSDIPPPPPGAPPPPPPSSRPPAASSSAGANFGQRLGAAVIDWLVTGIPFVILIFIGIALAPTEIVLCDEGFGLCEQPTDAGVGIIVLFGLIGLVGILAYTIVMEGGSGQTVGKKAVNIKRVDVATGQPIGTGRGVGLVFGKWISGIPCYLGYLWMLWDADQQTWHDKMTTSKVVAA